MAAVPPRGVIVGAEALEGFSAAILRQRGVPDEDARIVAHHLVEANLMGHDSHGVGMLPQYCTNLTRGICNLDGDVRVVREEGSVVALDAQCAFGQVIMPKALERAAAVARRSGVCALTVRRAHHVGRVGAYAEHAASLGLVSVFFGNINDHAPIVAPFGGSDARGSTNPISLGVPRRRNAESSSVVLDMATSLWPVGKVRVAFNRFEQLPDGVIIDSNGKSSHDPAELFPGASRGGAYTLGMKSSRMGALLPFGVHKGSGLCLFCELFGALAGGGTSAAGSPNNPASERRNGTLNNVFCLLIDPSALGAGSWSDEVEEMLSFWAASPPGPGAGRVLLPGGAERLSAAQRSASGIPLEGTTWEALVQLGREGGVAAPPTAPLRAASASSGSSRCTLGDGRLAGVLLLAGLAFALGFAHGRSSKRA